VRDLKTFSTHFFRRSDRLIVLSVLGLAIAIALFTFHLFIDVDQPSPLISARPLVAEKAIAQGFNRLAVARRVYAQLPDFPLENHYIHTETNEVAEDNTLVSRLLQYHFNVKRRPLFSRFDWKLTLADYLGVNDRIYPEIYPDRRLESNPYESDVAIIQSLNRQQRDELIHALLVAIATR